MYLLVVDDDEALRESLVETLQDEGYEVDSACHGLEAIEKLRAKPGPCLVLLDLMMPVMTGWDFLDEMKKWPMKPPVLVMTASRDHLPPGPIVKKPVSLPSLLKQVAYYCQPVPPLAS